MSTQESRRHAGDEPARRSTSATSRGSTDDDLPRGPQRARGRAEDALLRADERRRRLRAGRQHPQRLRPLRERRRAGRASSGPTAPASRPCSRRSSAWSRSARGSITLRGENITGLKANRLVAQGVGFVPQTNNVFPSLTIEENLQMGVYQAPKQFKRELRVRHRAVPRARRPARPAGRLAVRRRAADGRDGPGADDGAVGAAAGRALGRALARPAGRGVRPHPADQPGRRLGRSWSSRTPAAACRSATAGYVLDQGRNAYTASGKDLANDPKVIELYLGTLAKA